MLLAVVQPEVNDYLVVFLQLEVVNHLDEQVVVHLELLLEIQLMVQVVVEMGDVEAEHHR